MSDRFLLHLDKITLHIRPLNIVINWLTERIMPQAAANADCTPYGICGAYWAELCGWTCNASCELIEYRWLNTQPRDPQLNCMDWTCHECKVYANIGSHPQCGQCA